MHASLLAQSAALNGAPTSAEWIEAKREYVLGNASYVARKRSQLMRRREYALARFRPWFVPSHDLPAQAPL